MSPAAQMPSAEVSSVCEQRTPPVSPSSRPDERASMTSGIAPVPEHHEVGSSTRPDSVTTRCTRPSPSKRASGSAVTHSMPCSPSTPAKKPPAAAPKRPASGASSSITSVQLLAHRGQRGRDLAGDVGAADQHHPLGLARRPCGSSRRCRARAGSGCPSRSPPSTRSRRTFAPVASSALPKPSSSLVESAARARLGVELHHARAHEQLDVVLAVPVGRVQAARPRAWTRRAGRSFEHGGRS